jgi:SAM-dependent methyltransferase
MSHDPFDHGAFWDAYSATWERDVGAPGAHDALGSEWSTPEVTGRVLRRFAFPYLHPEAAVLEIGPGSGKFSRLLVERCRSLTLADISRSMLARANQACGGHAREVPIEDGHLDLPAGSFDFVLSYDVFLHLEAEEVFRYFAGANRVLRPGGVFTVHTSTFETRWGLHSFLLQIRDQRPRIGSRYGGRMYPLTDRIMRRFAEHSGFAAVDAETHSPSKDLLYAFRKVRPARPWNFLATPRLAGRLELSERVGGSDRRELYSGRDAATGTPQLLLLGEADDERIQAAARAAVPQHPFLAAPCGGEVADGFSVARYPGHEPVSLTRVPPVWPAKWLVGFAEGLLAAHEHGLAHGDVSARFIVRDAIDEGLRLVGLYEPHPEASAEVVRRDIGGLARLLRRARIERGRGLAQQLGASLLADPSTEELRRVAAVLRDW